MDEKKKISNLIEMASQSMDFRRILGFTACGRNSFVTQPKSGKLIYIAGCVIIVYNPHLNTQDHLLTESKQTITTLAISDDGRYLAAADSGSQAMIRIWDLIELNLLIEIEVFDFELVTCMSFSGDGQILMSIGSHYDYPLPRLKAWNWRTKSLLVREYVSAKTRAISCEMPKGNFVIVSEASIQYWSLSLKYPDGEFEVSKATYDPIEADKQLSLADSRTRISINRWDASLGVHRDRSFCDVKCGRGPKNGFTFCIAKDGLLCELNEQGHLYKFVDVKTKSANCLGVSDNLIVVGCASGLIRCFTATELKFIRNLPRPHKLGTDISASNYSNINQSNEQIIVSNTKPIYPDVISVVPDEINNTIACVYNDHSIYIWDLSNTSCVVKRYSALYHSSCIWGIDMYPSSTTEPLLPLGSFITCSSDDTIRIWQPRACNAHSSSKPTPVDESLKIIFTDSTYKFLCNSELNDSKILQNQDYDSNEGLRCLKISPNGTELAVGSRSGAIKIYDLRHYTEIKNIAAHDAEVLCLEYSDPKKFGGVCYLASASRDKLIHIFDVSNDYNFLQTIDDHQSTITSLKFVNNIASDCLQLISCGADKKIIFRYGAKLACGQLNFVTKQFILGKSTFYDMEVDSESSCLMAACQDKMIRLFNVAQMKYQSSFKGSFSDDGTLIKVALDPSCTFLAASSTNKTINIYDYQRGECIASITYGLSDLVTDLKFSPDGRYLVACSGDGCIFIWASPPEILNAIGGNLATNLDQMSLYSCSLGTNVNLPNVPSNPDRDGKMRPANQHMVSVDERRLFGSQQVDSDEYNKGDNRDFVPASDSKYSISGQFNDKQQMAAQMYDGDQQMADFQAGSNLRKSNNLGLSRSAHILNNNNSHFDSSDDDGELSKLTINRSIEASNHLISVATGNLSTSLSINNRNKLTTPPKSSLYKQIRRSGHNIDKTGPPPSSASRLDALDCKQISGHYISPINFSNRAKTLANRSRLQSSIGNGAFSGGSSSTLRPSKSECNLEMSALLSARDNNDVGISMSGNQQLDKNFIYSEKLNLSKMNPASVPISRELCQYVVDELQAISKYATRLHQTLQANATNHHLSALIARGVQNSMDILSIVPPRVAHQRQFQSQINLSPVNMMLSRRSNRAQQEQQLQRGSSALFNGHSTTVLAGQQNSLYLSRKPNRYASLASETKLKRAGSEMCYERESDAIDSGFVNGNGDATPVGSQSQARLTLTTSAIRSDSNKVDQVLESYADRLFRMIQERCDQSGGAVSHQNLSPTSVNKSSSSAQL